MAFLAAKNVCRSLLIYTNLKFTTILSSQMKSLPLHRNFNAYLNMNKFRFYSQVSNKWVTLIFEKKDGTQIKRKGKVDQTIQELIGQDSPDFPGYGACDGTISCSTCHVILSKEDFKRLGQPTDEEEDTLDLSPCITNTSRLGCCITITPEMDGMVLKLPAEVKDLRNT